MCLQTAHIIYYIIGNTLELHPCRLLKVKNVNKWNPPELTILHQNLARKWTYIALQWNTKIQLNLKLAAPYNVYVIYQTRETVFHRDIQTPRGELKIRHAAEYFWRNSSCLDSRSMKHCLECLIYLILSQSKQKLESKRRSKIVKIYAKTGYPNLLHASLF